MNAKYGFVENITSGYRCSVIRENETVAMVYAYDIDNHISYIAEWSVTPETDLQALAVKIGEGNSFDENVWASDDPTYECPEDMTWAAAQRRWATVATYPG